MLILPLRTLIYETLSRDKINACIYCILHIARILYIESETSSLTRLSFYVIPLRHIDLYFDENQYEEIIRSMALNHVYDDLVAQVDLPFEEEQEPITVPTGDVVNPNSSRR